MRRLIVLVKPVAGIMCLGILLGVMGFLCAIFLTILAGEGVSQGLAYLASSGSYTGWTSLFTAMLVLALARGFLHYGEQYCNHYIAFRILAIIRQRVFQALRRLCPAKLESKDKGNLVLLITSDIELLEVFYAHTVSPIAIADIVSLVMVLFIGHAYIPAGIDFRNGIGSLSSFVLGSLYGLDEIIQYRAGEHTRATCRRGRANLPASKSR